MNSFFSRGVVLGVLLMGTAAFAQPENPRHFNPADVFELEYAADPQISPDGRQIVYVRNAYDVMTDRRQSNLWVIHSDGTGHRPLTTSGTAGSPRWSPSGDRVIYTANGEKGRQIFVRWMQSGEVVELTHLTESPGGLSWSPDGQWIVFSMRVAATPAKLSIRLPKKPRGAEWAEPARVIEKMQYRADGAGYLPDGFSHLFLLPADGGTPRQLTSGDFNHGGAVSWSPDGSTVYFAANRHPDWEIRRNNSEVFALDLASGDLHALTNRDGPDGNPVVSPDGRYIAYTGYDDQLLGFQSSSVYVMDREGGDIRQLTGSLDRSVGNLKWAAGSDAIYFQYTDEGNGKVGQVSLEGTVQKVVDNLGGTSIGRPYGGGSYSISHDGHVAYTYADPTAPADVALGRGANVHKLTALNQDLFGHKQLGAVEEIWYPSSFDDRQVQGWIIKPPNFDPQKKYPLILEIHGGPWSNYGDRFTAELQLFASAGYVVLYTNPRGSTSYGMEFANLIHHNYPGQDYDDLISGVDAVIEKGYVDPNQLFVTGGSGGGVLTSWIVGKTDRFRAAVVAKPVINWISFVGTSDGYATYSRYWFPAMPWEDPTHYWERSPLSLVGNVTTPTMLLTGEADYRTPMAETEQYYQALKLRGIDTAMVRIPNASHGIASRPSNLIAKSLYILAWFEKYRVKS